MRWRYIPLPPRPKAQRWIPSTEAQLKLGQLNVTTQKYTDPNPGLGSRLFEVPARAGSASLTLTLGITSSGAFTPRPSVLQPVKSFDRGPEPERQSRLYRPQTAQDFSGASSLALTLGITSAGSFTPRPEVLKPVRSFDRPPQVELQGRLFRPFTHTFGSASANFVFGASTNGSVPGVAPRLGLQLQGSTNQGDTARPVPEPQNPPGQLRVSTLYQASTPVAPPGAPPPTILVQGGSTLGNALGVTQGVPLVPPLEPKEQIPQCFVYLYSAPPIYSVVVPGSTNQGYKFKAYTPHSYPGVDPAQLFQPPATTLNPVYRVVVPGGSNQGAIQPYRAGAFTAERGPAFLITPPPAAVAPATTASRRTLTGMGV